MVKDRILDLFNGYPPPVRRVVAEVIRLEQEYISMKQPRLKDAVRQIVEKAVPSET